MYGHPSLVTEHARELALSPRAFFRWFWKQARQTGLFPESPRLVIRGENPLPPSPAPGFAREQAGGSLFTGVYAGSCIVGNDCPADETSSSIGSEKSALTIRSAVTRPYLGSKGASGAFQAIVAAMPAHDTYIETHRGTGRVLREKPPSEITYSIDLDENVFDAWPSPPGVIDVHADSVDYLDSFDYAGSGRVLIYADPPYVLEARTSHHRYKHDYAAADHVRLIDCLRRQVAKGAMVMLSGYRSALYDRLMPDWRRIEFQVMTRGGPRTECLWLSFPAESLPHWHDYAGLNFTDRQRIKRKAARWAENFVSMSPGERAAVLSSILACGGHKPGTPTGLTGLIPSVAVSSTTATKSHS